MREKIITGRLANNNNNYCRKKKTLSWQFEQGLATYERVYCESNENKVKSVG